MKRSLRNVCSTYNRKTMREYLTIRNFGPLAACDGVELKQVMVLVGESASGKSTFMKVAALMRYLYKKANLRSYLKHSGITRKTSGIRLDSMLDRMGLRSMLRPDTLIVYRVEHGETNYMVVIEGGKLQPLPRIAEGHLQLNKVSYVSEHRNVIPTWAEKSPQRAGAALGFYFHETNDDFAQASKQDKHVDLGYLGMTLHVTHPKGRPAQYTVAQDGTDAEVKLHEASSGIQLSAPIKVIVEHLANEFSFEDAFKDAILEDLFENKELTKFRPVAEVDGLHRRVDVHVEEPELSLFPDAQCRLTEELVRTALHPADDRHVSMMIATHSPYILNFFNILLNQTAAGRVRLEPGQVGLYRMYGGMIQNRLVCDEHGRWLADTDDLTETMAFIYEEFKELARSNHDTTMA